MAVIAAATALALNSLSPSLSSCYNYSFTKRFLNSSSSIPSRFDFSKTLTKPPSALPMDTKSALKVRTVYLNPYSYLILIFCDCNLSLY